MANLERTISIIFTGDNRLERTIREVEGAFGSIAAPVADLTNNLLLLETALLAAGTAFAVSAFEKAKVFESAVVDLQKVLGDDENIEEFKTDAVEISEKYGESAAVVLQSAAEYKQAGFTAEEAMQLTRNGMDLVIAGGVEASQASEILVATLKGFDAPASEAGRVLDILNEVSNKYATSVEELGVGMSKLSPIASQAGLSFEQTASLLVPVIEVFRSGDEAAIALKTGMLKLISDAKPVAEALEKLGVSQHDVNGKMRLAGDILHDVGVAFKGAAQEDKLFLAEQLVGIDQAARMVAVFDNLDKSISVHADAMKAAGSAEAEVALRLETAEVAVNRFATAFENVQVAVGNKFLVAIKDALGGATELEIALRKAVDDKAFDQLFDALHPQLQNLNQMFREAAKNLPEALAQVDFSPVVDALGELSGELGQAFVGIFGDIDVDTPESLAEVIQKLVDAFAGLTNVTAGVIKTYQPFFAIIGESIDRFAQMEAAEQKAAGELFGFAKMLTEFGQNLTVVLGVLGQTGASINTIFTVLGGTFDVIFHTAKAGFDLIILMISKLASMGGTVLGVLSAPLGLISDSLGSISTNFHAFADEADFLFQGATESAASSAKKIDGALWDVASALTDTADTAEFEMDKTGAAIEKPAGAAEKLKEAMELLSPSFAWAGVSAEEASAALKSITDNFKTGGEASQFLLNAMLDLTRAEIAPALKTIGVNQDDANKQLRSAGDIIRDVAGAFATMDDAAKLTAAQQLVGIDRAERMVEIFSALGTTVETESQKAAEAVKKVPEATKAATTSIEEDGKKMSQAFEGVGALGPKADAAGLSLEKLAEKEEKAKKEAQDYAIALGHLNAKFEEIEIEGLKVLHSFAELDLGVAKLEVEASKAGVTFGGVGDYFTKIGQDALQTSKSFSSLGDDMIGFSVVAGEMADELEGVDAKALDMAMSVTNAGVSLENTVVSFAKVQNASANVMAGWAKLDIEIAKLKISAEEAGVTFGGVGDHFYNLGQAAVAPTKSFDDLRGDTERLGATLIGMASKFKDVDPAALKTALAMQELTGKASETEMQFRKLDNETANIELAFAKLDIQNKKLDLGFKTEQLKADAAEAQKVLENLGQVIGSTGDNISSLFGTMASANPQDTFLRWDLEKAIKDEMESRQKAIEQQEKMSDAQLKLMEAKTRQIEEGNVEIVVNSDGLAPHLQSLWAEVIEQVQVTAAASQAQFLLGLPVV